MLDNTKKKKKTRIILAVVIPVILLTAGVLYFFTGIFRNTSEADAVFVVSVSEITGSGQTAVFNRFAGVVETQETREVNIEPGREIDEVFVEEGDEVGMGASLFSYKTDDIERMLWQVDIEIESMRNSINSSRAQIDVLEQERLSAPEEYQIDYTLQIQSLLAGISQTEYSIKTKQVEYDQLKVKLEHSVVASPMAGSVQAVNEPGSYDPMTGRELAFIVIMKGGDFLIKGTVSELNLFSLWPGMRVIIRSRIDETQTWNGTVTLIDTSRTDDGDMMGKYYYGGYGGMDGASKYAFFVEVDSIQGLIIGQHVTIELDNGPVKITEGITLPAYYIVDAKTGAFVWADNGKGRLEKRKLTLGGYDEELDSYVIMSGLSQDDYIAFPEPDLSPGRHVTKEFAIPSFDDIGMSGLEVFPDDAGFSKDEIVVIEKK